MGEEIYWGYLFVDIMSYKDMLIGDGYFSVDILWFYEMFKVYLLWGSVREFYKVRCDRNGWVNE